MAGKAYAVRITPTKDGYQVNLCSKRKGRIVPITAPELVDLATNDLGVEIARITKLHLAKVGFTPVETE